MRLLFSQVPAGEPDPLRDQKVFLRPGHAAAPVSHVSLFVFRGRSCKLSRRNQRKTCRVFVRAMHPNCLLCFDVESRQKNNLPLASLCVSQIISITEPSGDNCVGSTVQQLHLILISFFPRAVAKAQSVPEFGLL